MDPTDKAAISDLAMHLKHLSEELATERKTRLDEKSRGVSILSLHVPLLLILGLIGGLIAFGVGAGAFYHDVRSHVDNKELHADKNKVIALDGLAYSKELDQRIASSASDLEAAIRRNARAIKNGAECTVGKKGASLCKFVDPETLPLR